MLECNSNVKYLSSRFVLIGRNATYSTDHMKLRTKLIQQASFPEVATTVTMLPYVKKSSINIYQQYVKRAKVSVHYECV